MLRYFWKFSSSGEFLKVLSVLIFLHVQLFVIFILFFLNYPILIMYLYILKILICSISCFKFVKSCVALWNAVIQIVY